MFAEFSNEDYFSRHLSWLAFNARVLQEAQDSRNPSIERLRFLGIFSNNQDEFFRVKVSDIKRNALLQKAAGNELAVEQYQRLLQQIEQQVLAFNTLFNQAYNDICHDLKQQGLEIIDHSMLSDFHRQWLKQYFDAQVLPYIQPLIVSKNIDFQHVIEDHITYLFVEIQCQEQRQYAAIDVPIKDSERFVLLPQEKDSKRQKIILLDDVICYALPRIFSGLFEFDKLQAYSFKITRDAEYYLSEDDIDDSILVKMSKGIKQRLHTEPVRVVRDQDMPLRMEKKLKKLLGFTNYDTTLPGSRYRNFRDFISFPNFNKPELCYQPWQPMICGDFTRFTTVFEAISDKDILLHYPYHSFNHFTEFVRQASYDPRVTSIKLNIYRVAAKSQVIGSLLDAVRNGKKVTVNVELRARFDESNNIEWSKRMTDAGIKVLFGIPSLKVHSKLCLVNRQENGEIVKYAQISTGNFNEDTAKIYTDFAYFTKKQQIAEEVNNVFRFIEHSYKQFNFDHLLLSPINQREQLERLIQNEIINAKASIPASITLKLNNLVDQRLIDKLYLASAAGVTVRLLIRGMCSLIADHPKAGNNITVISVVDRYLEHSRVMIFYANGANKVFLSSADWMTRNIEDRVEVSVPIYEDDLKQQIIDMVEFGFNDNCKARIINASQTNDYVTQDGDKARSSQQQTYLYLKALEQTKLVSEDKKSAKAK
ncbi:polyphosphate kinase 1 [Thalassotalea ponticola]|uniref:polyphosphate kinase 1 n=1 Tax=Thalassotalea ponticola TaxID=1523392 RepID=UPI0025B62859|nr:polyphosphate kinase 1 [Thalassotalea ponticola]MDN3652225.1 polyphosphate kinase 1 [Thalassotalea ponticola]